MLYFDETNEVKMAHYVSLSTHDDGSMWSIFICQQFSCCCLANIMLQNSTVIPGSMHALYSLPSVCVVKKEEKKKRTTFTLQTRHCNPAWFWLTERKLLQFCLISVSFSRLIKYHLVIITPLFYILLLEYVNKTNSRKEECCLNTLEKFIRFFYNWLSYSQKVGAAFFSLITQIPAANNFTVWNMSAFIS